ncbi:hypothetical protein M0R19_08055 [Candidatus Pacearchaeota archaeon]|nr:hypothetical protein [Candidatus Pacearchaeota archaeon]
MKKCEYECGDGWISIIEEAIEKLEKADPEIVIEQVKEKFGELRIYIESVNEETREIIRSIINEAEIKANKTCECCGKPGKLRQSGWWKTLCDDCDSKTQK